MSEKQKTLTASVHILEDGQLRTQKGEHLRRTAWILGHSAVSASHFIRSQIAHQDVEKVALQLLDEILARYKRVIAYKYLLVQANRLAQLDQVEIVLVRVRHTTVPHGAHALVTRHFCIRQGIILMVVLLFVR